MVGGEMAIGGTEGSVGGRVNCPLVVCFRG